MMPDFNIIVSFLIEADRWQSIKTDVPVQNLIESMIKTTLCSVDTPALSAVENLDVSVVLMKDDMIQSINRDHRDKDKPTNVLSFPQFHPEELSQPASDTIAYAPLGDILLSLETIEREAADEGKTLTNHIAHLTVHGTLHLLGYDHMNDAEAETMEGLETQILTTLGFKDPYG